MIVVDSSVWIDMLRRRSTQQTEWMRIVPQQDVVVADLVLMEVLQGARDETHAQCLSTLLSHYEQAEIGGLRAAHEAARHARFLRGLGITMRGQIDLLLGSFCLTHEHELLHANRDFAPMVLHLGLRLAAGSLPPH